MPNILPPLSATARRSRSDLQRLRRLAWPQRRTLPSGVPWWRRLPHALKNIACRRVRRPGNDDNPTSPGGVVVAALATTACGAPDVESLRESFAAQLAANRFIRDFQQNGDDLSSPGPARKAASRNGGSISTRRLSNPIDDPANKHGAAVQGHREIVVVLGRPTRPADRDATPASPSS